MELKTPLTSILKIHNLSNGACKALLGLLSFRNKNTGLCCPSIETLQDRLGGAKKRSLIRWLGELRQKGIVLRTRRRGSNSYRFEFSTNSGKAPVETCGKPSLQVPKVAFLQVPKVAFPLEQTVFNYEECGVDSTVRLAPAVAQNPATPPLNEKTQNLTPTQTQAPPVERRPPARAQAVESEAIAKVRDSLHAMAQEARLSPPDDELVRMVVRAARGATGQEICVALVALWKSGKLEKMRGWGFIPVKIADCFRGREDYAQKTG